MKKSLLYSFGITALLSCGAKDNPDTIEITQEKVSLYRSETHAINAKSQSKIDYTSSNDYHASVDDKGIITANLVGETEIDLKNQAGSAKTVTVEIPAKYNTYVEPDLDFGLTSAQIVAKYGTPRYIASDGIIYNGSGHLLNKAFILTDGKVNAIGMTISGSRLLESVLFISERYMYAYEFSSGDAYINALTINKATLLVAHSVSSSLDAMILYMKPPNSGAKESQFGITSNIEKLNDLIKKL